MKTVAAPVFAVSLAVAVSANAGEYKVYFGNLHAHTSYSDGKLTPREAYEYARDKGKLDFMTVTDHMESMTTEEWQEEHTQADAVNQDGVFVALQGYEWGSPPFNHLNFWQTDKFFDVDSYFYDDIKTFWKQVVNLKTDPIVQFNHPDWQDDHTAYPKFNWDYFEPYPAMDGIAKLIEIKEPGHEKSWQLSLDKGWHASPVFNQDNHSADWGTQNDCRAAIWMESLSRAGMIEAMKAGRTYSTCDKNAVMWLKGNGQWMGSRTAMKPVSLEWSLSDPDSADLFTKIEIVGTGGIVLYTETPNAASATGTFTADPGNSSTAWYYLRATINNKTMLYSAPVYYDESLDAGVQDSGPYDGRIPFDGGGDVLSGAEPSESSACSCSALRID
jgi:hypothetical protein